MIIGKNEHNLLIWAFKEGILMPNGSYLANGNLNFVNMGCRSNKMVAILKTAAILH